MSQIENEVQSQNPFGDLQITNQQPTPPTTEFIQTQNNNANLTMTDIVNQSQTNSENHQIMNQFANMVTGQQPIFQPQPQNQQPVFQPQPQQPQNQQPVFQPQQTFQSQQNHNTQQQYNFTNGQQTIKYNTHEVLWFINPKLKTNNIGNECALLICTFNADFGNLNLRFANIKNMYQTCIISQDMERLPGAVNLYAEHCSELLCAADNATIQIIERVFKANTGWQPAYSVFQKLANNSGFIVSSIVNNIQYQYTIMGYQYYSFQKALEFVCSGQGWLVTLLDRILTK